MSSNERTPSRGENRELSVEGASLAQAVTNAHQKLILANKRDILLSSGDAEGSYRYTIWAEEGASGIDDKQAVLRLIPNRRDMPTAKVKQLYLRIPMKPLPQANAVLVNTYNTNVLKNIADEYWHQGIDTPRYVPTNDVFGRAINAAGHSIDFLLTPRGLLAYGTEDDIVMSRPSAQLAGQHYDIEPSLDASIAQSDLETNWFSVEELETMLLSYEPDTHGASASANGAA